MTFVGSCGPQVNALLTPLNGVAQVNRNLDVAAIRIGELVLADREQVGDAGERDSDRVQVHTDHMTRGAGEEFVYRLALRFSGG